VSRTANLNVNTTETPNTALEPTAAPLLRRVAVLQPEIGLKFFWANTLTRGRIFEIGN